MASRDLNRLTAWALTTGEAGMRTQARGLASAVAAQVIEKVAPVRPPWRWLASGPLLRMGLAPDAAPIEAPWPDVIVSCGRRSGVLAREARRLAGGAPLLVHVQDPRHRPDAFDLVIAMDHDPVSGANVIKVPTALHDVTPQRLGEAAAFWRERLAPLGRPLIGAILGGPAGRRPFGEAQAQDLLDGLLAMQAEAGAGLAVVPSRRTPDEALAVFQRAAARDARVWVWDRTGDNPYLGVLALADRLVVTGDSVSMVSEALATTHPVEIYAGELRERHRGFLAGLEARGLVRMFDGRWSEPVQRTPVDATELAAQAVREMLARKL